MMVVQLTQIQLLLLQQRIPGRRKTITNSMIVHLLSIGISNQCGPKTMSHTNPRLMAKPRANALLLQPPLHKLAANSYN